MCGEHVWLSVPKVGCSFGPSPRVRGTRHPYPSMERQCTVHPRVCGEHKLDSSYRRGELRSIPACAGNTSGSRRPLLWLLGPSPRVRGTRSSFGTVRGTFSGPSPRVRGTPVPFWLQVGMIFGPSPRVRGTRHLVLPQRPQSRSIPACAGNTLEDWRKIIMVTGPSPRVRGTRSTSPFLACLRTVHPRVCGEHEYISNTDGLWRGPSPRVRGTPPRSQRATSRSAGPSPRVRGTRGCQ